MSKLSWAGLVGGPPGRFDDGVFTLGPHIADRCSLNSFFHGFCKSQGVLAHLLNLYHHSLWDITHAFLLHGLVLELGLLSLLAVHYFPHSFHHSTLPLDMLHHPLHVGFKLGQLLRHPLL